MDCERKAALKVCWTWVGVIVSARPDSRAARAYCSAMGSLGAKRVPKASKQRSRWRWRDMVTLRR